MGIAAPKIKAKKRGSGGSVFLLKAWDCDSEACCRFSWNMRNMKLTFE
jgi:hypothetical protein